MFRTVLARSGISCLGVHLSARKVMSSVCVGLAVFVFRYVCAILSVLKKKGEG